MARYIFRVVHTTPGGRTYEKRFKVEASGEQAALEMADLLRDVLVRKLKNPLYDDVKVDDFLPEEGDELTFEEVIRWALTGGGEGKDGDK